MESPKPHPYVRHWRRVTPSNDSTIVSNKGIASFVRREIFLPVGIFREQLFSRRVSTIGNLVYRESCFRVSRSPEYVQGATRTSCRKCHFPDKTFSIFMCRSILHAQQSLSYKQNRAFEFCPGLSDGLPVWIPMSNVENTMETGPASMEVLIFTLLFAIMEVLLGRFLFPRTGLSCSRYSIITFTTLHTMNYTCSTAEKSCLLLQRRSPGYCISALIRRTAQSVVVIPDCNLPCSHRRVTHCNCNELLLSTK